MAAQPPAKRAYDATGRRAVAARHRQAVLTACHELLLTGGYQATTIRAVAERAGVSAELVYKAFGSKPGLMKAVYDTVLAGDDDPCAHPPHLRQQAHDSPPGVRRDARRGVVS